MPDALYDAIVAQLTGERAEQLQAELAAVTEAHNAKITADAEKAVEAARGKKPTPDKRTRKPRSDKGRRRGLPRTPTITEVPQPACAECEHFRDLHESGENECGALNCTCGHFVAQDEIPAGV